MVYSWAVVGLYLSPLVTIYDHVCIKNNSKRSALHKYELQGLLFPNGCDIHVAELMIIEGSTGLVSNLK